MKKKLIITLIIVILLLSIVLIYSKKITSHSLKVTEYGIVDKNIPDEFHGLKIVHFSDVQYGKLTNLNDLKKVINKINELNPDVVIFTGDFFNKNIKVTDNEKEKIKNLLLTINSKYENYAILGDNDLLFKDLFYQIFNDNFIILDNESNLLYISSGKPIRFIGLNDITKEEIINDEDNNKLYNILLLHKPDEIESLKNKYNIVFAGHSMGGQIKLPFYGPLIKLNGAKKYISGEYKINDTLLYVNDGIGSESINMRIGNKPKINFYRIYNH